jgi:hypothetical protein
VVVERIDAGPGAAGVVRDEEAGRLDTGEQRVELVARPGGQVPYRRQTAFVRVVRGGLEDVPAQAAIVAAVHVRAPYLVVGGRPAPARVTRVQPGVIDLAPHQERLTQAPAPAVRRARQEQPALRAYADNHFTHSASLWRRHPARGSVSTWPTIREAP